VPEKKRKTKWHLILGTMLKYLLTPLGIIVELEAEVMSEPPRADILLLRRNTEHWTSEQFALLPDGIRDSQARYVLLEFKYTESINTNALLQVANNQRLYLQSHSDIKPDDLQSFLISSKQPLPERLEEFGFYEVQAGVYCSNISLIKSITLLSLNTLPNTPHNAWLRCFASQKQQQEQAFGQLEQIGLHRFGEQLYSIVNGLYKILFRREIMDPEKVFLTPEFIMDVGKSWADAYRNGLTVEERLEGLSSDEVLSRFSPEERLQGLAPEERLQGLTPEQIKTYLQTLKHS